LHCQKCNTETSIISGTIFEKTRYPLRTWFYAVWLVTSQKFGANALGVKRALGLGSYQTAWVWLHKLRRAMVRPGRDLLHGNVEIDETYVGGKKKEGKRGRGAECKEIVVIALEIHDPKGYGRVRMKRIPDVSTDSLIPFVCETVKPGSVIQTDGWSGYSALTKHGYIHKQIVQSSGGDPAHVTMPGVHRIASLLKRVLLSTHQGAVRGKHLDYYLDEYTFRFNRRTSRSRGLLFYRLMQQAVETEVTTYRAIVDGSSGQ
jgi:transposase-like protein